jgi:4-hydroxybenzoate polyprenyltransferase
VAAEPAALRTPPAPLHSAPPEIAAERRPGRLGPYARIARPHHWFKNLLMIPGALLLYFFHPGHWHSSQLAGIFAGFVCACLISASNYVLNEILDSPSDALHPEKAFRPIPTGKAKVSIAYVEWLALLAAGLAVGFAVNPLLGCSALALWVAGTLYNVPPVRLKDRPYLDVLSESVNNPIRLVMGWYAVAQASAPPWWILLAYWMLGAFLMAIKRFAEYRMIADKARASRYRRSFGHYDESRLIASTICYGALFGVLSGVFVVLHRLELLLAAPLVAVAMGYYVHLGFKDDSPVRDPDHLYRDRKLVILWTAAFAACAILLFVDLPAWTALFDSMVLSG